MSITTEARATAQTGTAKAPPLTREALYVRVWEEPILVLATRYGLSNVGLSKLCRRLSIPISGRGYWQKVRAGQPVLRTSLPERPTRKPNVIILRSRPGRVTSSSFGVPQV